MARINDWIDRRTALMQLNAATVLWLLSLWMLSTTTANAECVKIDYENNPIATVSGRITNYHQVPKGDLRAAKGIFLVLDRPLRADLGEGCTNVWKIVISETEEDTKRTKRQLIAGKRVKMTGKLDRFGSALVDPPVFIANYEIE